jgi:uncharacterized protein DUF6134
VVPVAALRPNLPDLTEAGNRTYILRIARGFPSEGRGMVAVAFILGSGRMGETPVMRPLATVMGLIFALLAAGPAAAASNDVALATFPPAGRLDYKVVREGDDIGTQSVEFIRSGDRLTVRTHVNILVTVLGIPVFRFTHEAEEQWRDGQLTAFKSKSNDDGEPRDVALKLDGDRLRGTYNGRTLDLPASLIPASLWRPDTVQQSVLMDPIKGRDRQVTVADKGIENIRIHGQTVAAHHYAMTGQIIRDIWYGPDGQIVQVHFPAKDGSEIQVVLR